MRQARPLEKDESLAAQHNSEHSGRRNGIELNRGGKADSIQVSASDARFGGKMPKPQWRETTSVFEH